MRAGGGGVFAAKEAEPVGGYETVAYLRSSLSLCNVFGFHAKCGDLF